MEMNADSGSIPVRSQRRTFLRSKFQSDQAGFTILEVLIAVIMFTIVSASLLSLFGYSVANMQMSQEELIARQKARETLEDIFAARNSGQLTWAQIYGVSNGGVFLDGANALWARGTDGLPGTAAHGPEDSLRYPGPNGVLGDSDDVFVRLSNFTRTIEIDNVTRNDSYGNPVVISDVREIKVTITYQVPTFGTRTYVVSAFISEYH